MAPRLRSVSLALAALLACPPAPAAVEEVDLALRAADAARVGEWGRTLELLSRLRQADPERYADGRFDYLAARALASTGQTDAALNGFLRFVGSAELFDVPARLAAAQLLFEARDGGAALDLLLPLLQRRGTYVARRALRIALDALETRYDPATLARLVQARPPAAARERRRLRALRAADLEASGETKEAAALREEILREAKRDDAAAIVLAREMRGAEPAEMPDRLLLLLIETARSQRDLELAEKLLVERDRRAVAGADVNERLAARFDLARLFASRGRFAEAAAGFRSLLALRPAHPRKGRRPGDDSPGTAGFWVRVRFNLAAALEKLGDTDGAERELARAERERAGP